MVGPLSQSRDGAAAQREAAAEGRAPVVAAARSRGRLARFFTTPDTGIVLLSVVAQLVLGVFLGHSRDMRLFMSAGYLVATGRSPYVPQDLTSVFHHVSFKAVSTVGYPPPWPLLLGLVYRATYAVWHDLLLYNLAIKLPVIAATVLLAYTVAAVLRSLGAGPQVSRRAWVFLLLNPFVIYVGAAWGQIDAIVALLGLAALWLLFWQRRDASAAVLALAVCFKPTALPLLLVALVYLATRSLARTLRYAAVFVAAVVVFYVLPFPVFGWDATPLKQLNSHFTMSGTMSFMTVVRLFRDPLLMQGHWWLLGLAWIPALAVAVLALRRGIGGFDDLIAKSIALLLVFFLARSWLSETNLVLVVPLALLLVSLERLDRRALAALWLLPLIFTLFNASPLRLLWVVAPLFSQRALTVADRYAEATLLARAGFVIAWQIVGWWIVIVCMRTRPEPAPGAPGVAAVSRDGAAGAVEGVRLHEDGPQEGARWR